MKNFLKSTILLMLSFMVTTIAIAQTRVLHYDETTGYDHNTRNQSFALFQAMKTQMDIR